MTELQWLDEVPTDRRTLVVAEGLLMYLREDDVRRLLQRLIDRSPGGEMHFDTLSALAPLLSKVFTRGIITWGIRDARRVAAWHPRLRFLEQLPALAGYEQIPSTVVRWIYKLTWMTAGRSYDVVNRFEY